MYPLMERGRESPPLGGRCPSLSFFSLCSGRCDLVAEVGGHSATLPLYAPVGNVVCGLLVGSAFVSVCGLEFAADFQRMALPRAKSLSFLTCVADTVAAGTRRIEPRRERRARRRRHAALSHGVLREGPKRLVGHKATWTRSGEDAHPDGLCV